jgi:predicted enzyme related to lactoylglutathione lyase
MQVVLAWEAEGELGHARDWYDSEAPGLGLRFLTEFDALIERLAIYKGSRGATPAVLDFGATQTNGHQQSRNPTMPPPLSRLILYARDVEATIAFYAKHFGFQVLRLPGDRIVELVARAGGANIMVHPAAKGIKAGQVAVKLVFDVDDVSEFCENRAGIGLAFGPVHRADGYSYANAKDPCGNNIQVSSRAFRQAD